MTPERYFKTRAECVKQAKRSAAMAEEPRFAVYCPAFVEAPWCMQLVAPLISCEWWQIDPDGLTVKHGDT